MKKVLLLLAALICSVTGAMADIQTTADLEAAGIQLGHYYRLISSNEAFDYPCLAVSKEEPYNLCGAVLTAGDKDQIWQFEDNGEGAFYMKTASGHYIAATSLETMYTTSTTDPVVCGLTSIGNGVYSPWWGTEHSSGGNGHCWLMKTDGTLGNWGPWTANVQYKIEEVIMGDHFLSDTLTYSVQNMATGQFAATNTEKEMTSLTDLDLTGEWRFIAASGDENYYIQNVSTGLYAQSSSEASSGFPITMGEDPVEYHVVMDATEGSSTYGYFGLCSTDQPEVNFDNAECIGWMSQDNGYVSAGSAVKGVDTPCFWTITKFVNPVSHALDESKIYTIKNKNFDQWASGVGTEILSADSIEDACKWQFIPTENSECYYVRNVATGLYAQSSADASQGTKVQLGATPVEYHVLMDSKEGSSTYGYFGLCSTEQNETNFDNSDCIGWNLVQGSHYVTGYSAQMGVNAKSFWTIAEWKAPVHHILSADKLYTIKNRNYDHYASDGTGQILASQSLSDLNKWQFIPTENDECYYIKSYTSGMYASGCVKSYYGSTVKLGKTPVEYHVVKDTDENHSTYGFFGLCSTTDQTSINFDDEECKGWNLKVNSNESFVTCDLAQMDVTTQSFWEIAEYSDNTIVTIKNKNFDQYLYVDEDANGIYLAGMELPEDIESASDDVLYQWELVPTDNQGCYYIKSKSTGYYAQSSAVATDGAKVLMGETPVEYSLMQDTIETSSTYGYWGFASTDQTVTDFSSAACIGWNLVQNSGYVTGYSAQMGVNAKSFWQLEAVRGSLPTAISSVKATTTTHTGAIYNLAGQRLSKMQRGINIVDGKKILVK